MTKAPLTLALIFLATACASNQAGWEGTDAIPFDTAQAACRAEATDDDPSDDEEAFLTCMNRLGWSRPAR